MNNNLIGLVIGAVVVVGGGYLAYNSFSGPGDDAKEEIVLGGSEGQNATFASLLARKTNLICTFEHKDGSNISSGTVYIADEAKRIRGDFTIEQGGAGPMEAHMIRDDGYNHMWGSFAPQGMKTKVTEEDEKKLFSTKDGGGISDDVTFNCQPWKVDAGKFSLPSGVTFMDVSAQVNQVNSQLDSVRAQQCAACSQAPAGTPREQCLTALGCN